MKKLILPFVLLSTIFFTACSTKTEEPKRDMILLNDEMYQNNMNTDTASALVNEPIIEEPVQAAATAKQNVQPVAQKVNTPRQKTAPVKTNNPAATPAVIATTSPEPLPAPVVTGTTETAATTGTNTTDEPKKEEKKDGLSKAAQGAIIGGVGGAVGGAIIGKKAKGAVIGGIIGAAGGYIIGRKMDKKADSTGN